MNKYKFYDKDKKPFLVEANTKREAVDKLLPKKPKKPNYRFAIFNKQTKKLMINPETDKALFFEYPIQAERYIERHLKSSTIYEVYKK